MSGIKKKLKKLKELVVKLKTDGDWKAFFAQLSFQLYDNGKIDRLKKNPPKLVMDRIVFETGNDFTDNGRALFDYMVEKGYNEKYELVWLVHEPKKYKKYKKKNVKFVKSFKTNTPLRTAKSHKYAQSAHYIFYTTAVNWVKMSRANQVFIDLWHGCGYKANKLERKVFFDYCLVPGDIFVETKKEFFHCATRKLLPLGYPRYDQMLRGSENAGKYVERLLKEASANKFILWMPTFRHSESERLNEETLNNEFNIPIIDDKEKLLELDAYCRAMGVLLVIKKHYLQVKYDFGDNKLTNIVYIEDTDLEKEDVQLYEFIHYADALVSDYSSVAIDYILMDRPLGFTLEDFEAYSVSRGWVFDEPLEYMPGSHIYNMNDMKQFVEDIKNGKDDHKAKRDAVREKTHNVSENYCQRVLDYFNITVD
ncbi:MAG: CDP-glycerol glycerophosphotransferase family protein [Lachnospiraceae bacterium]|nr:CDP-glycerol glycerophosphotransferase family protein [Lachnospiraceae bacterium]